MCGLMVVGAVANLVHCGRHDCGSLFRSGLCSMFSRCLASDPGFVAQFVIKALLVINYKESVNA